MSSNGELNMSGELETKLYPGGIGAPPNEAPRTYPDFYKKPVPGPQEPQNFGLWHRLRARFHSWNLNRKLKNGSAQRGHTVEPYEGRDE